MSTEQGSNSDSDVQADNGQAAAGLVETKKAASGKSQDDSYSDSETSEDSDQDQGEGNDAKDQDGDGDDEGAKDGEPKPKRNKNKNRIEKMRGRLTEKEQEIEYWKKQALKSQPNPESQKAEATKPVSKSEKPNPDNFNSWDEYLDARDNWNYEQRESDRKAKESETQLRSEYEKRNADHQARVKEYAKSSPGYQERVDEFLEDYGDIQFAPALERAFTKESGPALMDELLKTPEELVRINGLGYEDALHELWKVQSKIQSKKESANNTTKTSKAPSPVSPIGKGSVPVSKSLSDPNLTFSEYEKLRKQQLNKRK